MTLRLRSTLKPSSFEPRDTTGWSPLRTPPRRTLTGGGGETDTLGSAPSNVENTWPGLGLRTRAILDGKPGIVFLVGSDEEMGFFFDDVKHPWVTICRTDFLKRAKSEAETPDSAVLYVLKGPVSSGWGGIRAPSACLRRPSLVEHPNRWQAFKVYEALACPVGCDLSAQSNYGEPPNEHTLSAGDLLMCSPPFVSAVKGANMGPAQQVAKKAMLLSIMLGTEWNSTKKEDQVRRWCLVRALDAQLDYWVALKNVCPATRGDGDPHLAQPSELELRDAVQVAAEARKPSTVHGHTSHPGGYRAGLRKRPVTETDVDTSTNVTPTLVPNLLLTATGTKPSKKQAAATAGKPATAPAPVLNELGRTERRWGVSTLNSMDLEELEAAMTFSSMGGPPAAVSCKATWIRNALLFRSFSASSL